MKIIPAIYLSQGRGVSHYKGVKEQETVMSRDVFESARDFEKQGASAIHLVDLDARNGGSEENRELAEKIANATNLTVSYAGGISEIKDIEALFSCGIDYVSIDQSSENLIDEALQRFGADKIFFTIRTQKHVIENMPGIEVMDYGKDIADKGITKIILRDIKAEGTLHPNFDEVERLILATEADIFAFGGVGGIDDLEILKKTGAAGVMVSRAFFEGKLSLKECVKKFES